MILKSNERTMNCLDADVTYKIDACRNQYRSACSCPVRRTHRVESSGSFDLRGPAGPGERACRSRCCGTLTLLNTGEMCLPLQRQHQPSAVSAAGAAVKKLTSGYGVRESSLSPIRPCYSPRKRSITVRSPVDAPTIQDSTAPH